MNIKDNFSEIENQYYKLVSSFLCKSSGSIKSDDREKLDKYKRVKGISDEIAQELESIAKIKMSAESIEDINKCAAIIGSSTQKPLPTNIKKIVVTCDGGVGASAFGATLMRKIVEEEALDIKVYNFTIFNIESDVDLIITQNEFLDIVNESLPNIPIRIIDKFTNNEAYKNIIDEIKSSKA